MNFNTILVIRVKDVRFDTKSLNTSTSKLEKELLFYKMFIRHLCSDLTPPTTYFINLKSSNL